MNKLIILLIATFLSLGTIAAQNNETSSVTYNGANYSFSFAWQKNEKLNIHLPGLSFAFINLAGLDDIPNADLKAGKSYSVGLGLGDFSIRMTNHLAFGLGAKLDFSRYHFKGNVGLQEIPNDKGKHITEFVVDPEGREYKSSKLIIYYVTIPAIIEYQTKVSRGKRFFVNAGVEGLIKYYSKSQVDIKKMGTVDKTTLGRDLNILPLSARLVCNIGFNDFGLTAYYQPTSLFKSDRGPDVNSWGIGIAVGF